MNYSSGSMWRKWDLHVHTPDSIYHNYSGTNQWEKFIEDLENLPREFKVIGVNDYIFLDGYKRLLKEKNENDRLKNIDLLLPVIELRIDKFGGTTGHLSRVNYHVIFSNEINPETIETQFINALPKKYKLSPEYDHLKNEWSALPTRQSLEDLGNLIIETVPEEKRNDFAAPLIEGFNNLSFSLETINEALESHYFKKKYLTAVGKTEWADIKWNNHSIAEKKSVINSVNLVFISAETYDGWSTAKEKLTQDNVNSLLLDCSDAHAFSDSENKDRIGKCFTWIKADTTFEGLLQIINEPDERVFVGDIPDKLLYVSSNKTKYLKSISIKKKEDADLKEIWFNNDIPFNPALVAIIGNKGKGKSALSDIIGLLSNTKNVNFTFLSESNFRQPNNNKSRHFEAKLAWESGRIISKGLEEDIDSKQPELVKYIPQQYLEKICNQLPKVHESEFDKELKKVIFSHVNEADKLDTTTLDELLGKKTSEANRKRHILKQELHEINEVIVDLEDGMRLEYRERIVNLLENKKKELESHLKSPPETVTKPDTDPKSKRIFAEIQEKLIIKKEELEKIIEEINSKIVEQKNITKKILTINTLINRIDNLDHQIKSFVDESKEDFESIGLTVDKVFTYNIDKNPLKEKLNPLKVQRSNIDKLLDEEDEQSLEFKKNKIEKDIKKLQSFLDEPNQKYQAYLTAKEKWEKQKKEIIGSKETVDTIEFYKEKLEIADKLPGHLEKAKNNRIKKSKEIFAILQQLATTYRELYNPINEFIKKKQVNIQNYEMNFEVGIVDGGFEKEFFEIISHGITGTFCGVKEGTKTLQDYVKKSDFNSQDGIEKFLNIILSSLEEDKRPGGKKNEINAQLKQDKTVLSLYDMIFSLNYLEPRYSLRMGEKELHQLSPGERGTLLLIFYLLLDKSDIPLVVDQPEENLDNQTVYEVLVPCIKEAKKKRQIIIVTHNPNLAVVCDAEQIICANLNKKNNYLMEYTFGAIENPKMNQAVVDILEGTMPAFDNRDSKYM